MDESDAAQPRSREPLPVRGAGLLTAACGVAFVAVWLVAKVAERNCEWECLNFPLLMLWLGLGILFLGCLAVFVGMVLITLWREKPSRRGELSRFAREAASSRAGGQGPARPQRLLAVPWGGR